MTEPVAWRIYCTNNGATGYLYTEALPFNPGPGVNVRREPEPLFASPPSHKCLARIRAACAWPDCGCDPYATKVIGALVDNGWTTPPEVCSVSSRPSAIPPDWKQDQAETSRLAPKLTSTKSGGAT